MRCSFLLGFLLLGCGQDICIRHSDCVSGEMCSASGVCAVVSDGGVSDGVADADVEPDADAAPSAASSKRCVKQPATATTTFEPTEDCNGDGTNE